MATDTPVSPRGDGLTNILKNLGWLLGGKGFGAVCSLVYLAILARSLGLKDFGHFSLIFGTGQALVALASFQTWQTMVKFGAAPVRNGEWNRFGRLAWFCGTADVAGATVGCLVAFIVYFGFGEALDLNREFVTMAFAFNCALLWARLTTPNGIVRVLDRFDIGSYVEAVVPAGRLIAAFIILALGATVGRFLFAWAVIEMISAALYWFAAWKLAPQALRWTNFGHWRETLRENPGLGGFFGVTYANSTLDALYKQGPLLAVGYFLGTSAAGLYRMADQLAQSIGKLSTLIGRAVFPEFAIAHVDTSARVFRKLVRQVTAMAGIGGVVVTLVAIFLGDTVLSLIGGDAFAAGGAVLVPLAIGASFELAAVSYEPVLYSTGHARYAFAARATALVALALGIAAFLGSGPVGVGWAVAMGLAVFYVAMSFMVWRVMRKLVRQEAAREAEET